MVIFVDVTKMYAMILFVSYMQPAGALWLSVTFLWPACYVYISKRYIVMIKDNQGGGTMDLGARPVA
jgi:hypothetical protein